MTFREELEMNGDEDVIDYGFESYYDNDDIDNWSYASEGTIGDFVSEKIDNAKKTLANFCFKRAKGCRKRYRACKGKNQEWFAKQWAKWSERFFALGKWISKSVKNKEGLMYAQDKVDKAKEETDKLDKQTAEEVRSSDDTTYRKAYNKGDNVDDVGKSSNGGNTLLLEDKSGNEPSENGSRKKKTKRSKSKGSGTNSSEGDSAPQTRRSKLKAAVKNFGGKIKNFGGGIKNKFSRKKKADDHSVSRNANILKNKSYDAYTDDDYWTDMIDYGYDFVYECYYYAETLERYEEAVEAFGDDDFNSYGDYSFFGDVDDFLSEIQ